MEIIIIIIEKIGISQIFKVTFLYFYIFYLIKIVAADWADGYYDSNGTCAAWLSTCLTCTNATTWTSWRNRILNTTTFQWDLWPDGQFYSDPLGKWFDWSGSWIGQWAYRMKWFDCSSYASQGLTMFSLSQMKCVSNWSSIEVHINDPQLNKELKLPCTNMEQSELSMKNSLLASKCIELNTPELKEFSVGVSQ